MKSLSRVRLFVTPWTVAHQASPWNFLGKNNGVGCHFLLQGIFPTRDETGSPALWADALQSEPPKKKKKLKSYIMLYVLHRYSYILKYEYIPQVLVFLAFFF